MRNMFYWAGIISILICLPLRVSAQSYEQMWKQVEVLEQKQLPKSAIQELRKIYEYAKQEKNVSQMMKAHLTRASLCIDITPDSLDSELSALKAWMEEEKDTVYQAILNNLLGYYILDTGKKMRLQLILPSLISNVRCKIKKYFSGSLLWITVL